MCHVSFPMGHTTPLPGAWWGRDRDLKPKCLSSGTGNRADITGRWGRPPPLWARPQDGAPRPRGCVGWKGELRCPVASLKAKSEAKTKALGREAAGKPQPLGTRPEVTTAGVLPGHRATRDLSHQRPPSWDGGCSRAVPLASVRSGVSMQGQGPGLAGTEPDCSPGRGGGWQHGDPQVLTHSLGGRPAGVSCTSVPS